MHKLLRINAVIQVTSLKKSSIYENIKSGKFPEPVKIGFASAWLESEVEEWIRQRASERRRSAWLVENNDPS